MIFLNVYGITAIKLCHVNHDLKKIETLVNQANLSSRFGWYTVYDQF